MENSSNVIAESAHRTYWPMARAANADLLLISMPRVNLLLTGTPPVLQEALMKLMPMLRGPVQTWSAVGPLELPPPTTSGTLVLRDVDALSAVDQYRLLKWLDLSAGRTQVISTTGLQLRQEVDAGAFHSGLYYRLNVACVDLTE